MCCRRFRVPGRVGTLEGTGELLTATPGLGKPHLIICGSRFRRACSHRAASLKDRRNPTAPTTIRCQEYDRLVVVADSSTPHIPLSRPLSRSCQTFFTSSPFPTTRETDNTLTNLALNACSCGVISSGLLLLIFGASACTPSRALLVELLL